MTLRQVIEVIIEVVERQLLLARQKVGALTFEEANRDALTRAAQAVNGQADFFSPSGGLAAESAYDVLFIDRIPLTALGGIALGLGEGGPGALVHTMLSRGKPVFVLYRTVPPRDISPAYGRLFEAYQQALERYGVVFLEGEGRAVEADVYDKKVLTREDVLKMRNTAGGGRIVVREGVVITGLARDTAQSLGIEIVRKGDGVCT